MSSGEHLKRLLTDLIDLSRLQAGEMRLVAGAFEVQHVLELACQMAAPQAAAAGTKLVYVDNAAQASAATSRVVATRWEVSSDRSRLQQVVLNLLNNAIKFTPSGSVTVSLDVSEVDASSVGDIAILPDSPDTPTFARVEIAVRDTGIGERGLSLSQLWWSV